MQIENSGPVLGKENMSSSFELTFYQLVFRKIKLQKNQEKSGT